MNLSVCFVTPDDADDALLLAAARGGATLVQLRDKRRSDAALVAQLRRLKPAFVELGVDLIVNDRLDVALTAGIGGLHLGQRDGDPVAARDALGPDAILGLSVEHRDQLATVPWRAIDYLGVGPVRATRSKTDHATPIGFDGLADIVARSKAPCLAIGGLDRDDIPALHTGGVAGIAVISAIAARPDPERAARNLRRQWEHP